MAGRPLTRYWRLVHELRDLDHAIDKAHSNYDPRLWELEQELKAELESRDPAPHFGTPEREAYDARKDGIPNKAERLKAARMRLERERDALAQDTEPLQRRRAELVAAIDRLQAHPRIVAWFGQRQEARA